MKKKLNFLFDIIHMDESSLAYQVLKVQEKFSLPGLVQECKVFIKELNLPNIFMNKNEAIKRMKRNKWKELVKKAIIDQNEIDLKSEIKK